MCTIVVMRGVRADLPLVIATNRDEFYARKSTGPVRLLESPRTVGGRDLVAGGTWMGVTEHGLFVGITNHRSLEAPDAARLSRGQLVLDALALGDRQAILSMLRGVDGRAYNPFNLMWGDAEGLMVAYGRSDRAELSIESVPEGIHVLPNDRLDSPSFVKVERARTLLEDVAQADLPTLLRQLTDMLGDRMLPRLEDIPDPPPSSRLDRGLLRELAALCVRTPVYGTCSSTIVLLQRGKVDKFLFAEGPPDQAAFKDVTSLLTDVQTAST